MSLCTVYCMTASNVSCIYLFANDNLQQQQDNLLLPAAIKTIIQNLHSRIITREQIYLQVQQCKQETRLHATDPDST